MTYSDEFKINVNKLNSDELVLVLLEINHPFLSQTIRLVNDNRDFLLNGNNYLAMPFQITRQNDVQGEIPKVSLVVSNVGRSLIRWVDSTGGGKGATISIVLARRSDPNKEEERVSLNIERVSVTTQTVTFSLIVQNNFTVRAVKTLYDMKRAPGLF